MSKSYQSGKCVFKIFGIKILEIISDCTWKAFDGDTEEIRDDIILHERISDIVNNENKNDYE